MLFIVTRYRWSPSPFLRKYLSSLNLETHLSFESDNFFSFSSDLILLNLSRHRQIQHAFDPKRSIKSLRSDSRCRSESARHYVEAKQNLVHFYPRCFFPSSLSHFQAEKPPRYLRGCMRSKRQKNTNATQSETARRQAKQGMDTGRSRPGKVWSVKGKVKGMVTGESHCKDTGSAHGAKSGCNVRWKVRVIFF